MMQLIGEIRGIKSRTVNKDGKTYQFDSVVVEDEDFESHDIALGQDRVKAFDDAINKLVGKTCAIPFYIRRYTSKNGTQGTSLNYSGADLPTIYHGKNTVSSVG